MKQNHLKHLVHIFYLLAIYLPGINSTQDVSMPIDHMDMKHFKVVNPEKISKELDNSYVPIIVYKRSDPNNPMDAMTVEFGGMDKVVIYIHGYATSDIQIGTQMKNALFQGTDDVDCVALIDWRKWSLPHSMSWYIWPWNYRTVAIKNVPWVSEKVRHFLRTKLTNDTYIYIIGHSLGAQVAGTAARTVASDGLTVDRITALDPAGPIFEHRLNILFNIIDKHTLRSTDAQFVDVIHTSTQLGMVKPAGHLDTYLVQNDCISPSCTHSKAVELYMSSLTRCSLISCPQTELCTSKNVQDFGYLSDMYKGRGRYTLTITTKRWWQSTGWNDKKCSQLRNLYLPAKNRICHQSPNNDDFSSIGNCTEKPYLSECEMICSINGQATKKVCSTSSNVKLPTTDKHAHKRSNHVNWFGGECNENMM